MTPLSPHYLHSGLDRRNDLRGRQDWLSAAMDHPNLRVLPYWQGKALMDLDQQPVRLAAADRIQLEHVLQYAEETVLLGEADGTLYVTVDLSAVETVDRAADLCGGGRFHDLRRYAPELMADEAALLAQSRAVLIWHQRHRFCGVCGSPTEVRNAGYERHCTNEACRTPQYPRLDPAVIMLVTHGDKCLLGRGYNLPPEIISTLAGFIEPGENLEQAVAREVMEEVGLRVGMPTYKGSQPWPFPTSLMLGFHVEALDTDIRLDEEEMEFAGWFSRNEVQRLDELGYRMPRQDSIANLLIQSWLAEG